MLSPPRNDATPITPSRPVTANSADAPLPVTLYRETRPAVEEIQILLPVAGAVNDPTQRQRNGLKFRNHTLVSFVRQRGKKMVSPGRRHGGNSPLVVTKWRSEARDRTQEILIFIIRLPLRQPVHAAGNLNVQISSLTNIDAH